MLYRTMGWLHAATARAGRSQAGQGTVEYVGLLMLLATVLFAVVAATKGKDHGIANAIVEKLKDTIDSIKPEKA